MEFTDPSQVAVCNLASICLPKFAKLEKEEAWPNQGPHWPMKKEHWVYEHDRLHEIAKVITRNLNRVIDSNYYPVKEAEFSNMRNRPIGIGVQGLADTFQKMRIAYSDP